MFMRMWFRRMTAVCLCILSACASKGQGNVVVSEQEFRRQTGIAIPAAPREFRAAWIATVSNIDWPSRPGLSSGEQQRELVAILDRIQALHMNAVVLQIRPSCDAFYPSEIEPWSSFLTGEMGKPPEPFYDPLAFAVEEAHKRGLELHTWFNPYRALTTTRGGVSDRHISKRRPEIVREAGRYLWLDPSEPVTQDYTLAVMMDVVRRYDIDGLHIDDYFYPYPDYLGGKEFPDEAGYARYRQGGGTLSRDDWRRHNVNEFVKRMYETVKAEKPWVKVGISPFGIWRPNHPPGVQGFDQYDKLYADAKLWLNKGWLDYWTPQLYWKIDSPQPYEKLLDWWIEQNPMRRNMWPGLGAHRLSEANAWPAQELVNQVEITRRNPGASGVVFFSMKALMNNTGNLATALREGPYRHPAFIPTSPWLGATPPPPPRVSERLDDSTGGAILTFHPGEGGGKGASPFAFGVYQYRDRHWSVQAVPAKRNGLLIVPDGMGRLPEFVAVSSLDRLWNESQRVVVRLVREVE